jgi:hypothetical protein
MTSFRLAMTEAQLLPLESLDVINTLVYVALTFSKVNFQMELIQEPVNRLINQLTF